MPRPPETATEDLTGMAQFVALMERRGREVLATFDTPDGWIVLCITSGVQPYTTWAADPAGNTFWGHYFDRRSEAEADFAERIRKGY